MTRRLQCFATAALPVVATAMPAPGQVSAARAQHGSTNTTMLPCNTVGRLEGTAVSSRKYKLKKYAGLDIEIPESEQGAALCVRTEVLEKGPVQTYVEQGLDNGEVNVFPGQSEQ